MNKLLLTTLASSVLLCTGSIAAAQPARARNADTPIRLEASLSSVIIATLSEGAPVDVVSLQDDWYRVLVPNAEGAPRVGYALTHLIEIIDANQSPQSVPAPSPPVPAPPLTRPLQPIDQGPPIAPTLAWLSLQRVKATEREQLARATERELALKAEVDARQAELDVLQPGQPATQMQPGQIPRAAPPLSRARAREGFWFNGGLGFGSVGCTRCGGDTLSGLSGGVSLGTTITDTLMLGAGTAGYSRFSNGGMLTVGTLDARVRFYPVRTYGFFVTGGLGLGSISEPTVRETGLGTVYGLGWDIPVRPNLSVTPFWNGFTVNTSNLTAHAGQLGLGITIR